MYEKCHAMVLPILHILIPDKRWMGKHLLLVFCMGNPWVIWAVPVPIPMKTHTRATGTGNYCGYVLIIAIIIIN